jgi:hypothetical protein
LLDAALLLVTSSAALPTVALGWCSVPVIHKQTCDVWHVDKLTLDCLVWDQCCMCSVVSRRHVADVFVCVPVPVDVSTQPTATSSCGSAG